MERKKCCVLIPTYKNYNGLSKIEKKFINNNVEKMKNWDIILMYPNGINIDDYKTIGISNFISFDKKHFKNVNSYSELMLSTFFYETFKEYEYMLIVQTDAYVFEDKLDEFIKLDYDYIGGLHNINQGTSIFHPNVGDKLINGNGGFSLRKIDAFIEASKNIRNNPKGISDWEDVMYSYWYKDEMNIAPDDISLKFGWQQNPEKCYEDNNNKLPFGAHKPHIFGKNFDVFKEIIDK